MTDAPGGNGRVHDDELDDDELDDDELDEDALDDDAPLTAGEAEDAAAVAGADTDETLDERVETVVEDLDGVERRRAATSVAYVVGDRVFAVLDADVLEVALDPVVATAALKTSDTTPSTRGKGWITFAPGAIDRFALDRAEAWLRSAHRRALA